MKESLVLASLGAIFVLGSLGASAREFGAPDVGETDLQSAPLRAKLKSARAFSPPMKVVSSSLLSDEMLEGVLPWDRWAGVSYVVDWPSSTPVAGHFPEKIPRTSGKTEDLLSRQPDLVVLSAYNSALVAAQLSRAGIPLFVLETPTSFSELFSEWTRLGARLGEEKAVARKINETAQMLEETQALGAQARDRSAQKRKALLLQGSFSYGGQSLQGDCLRLAGFQNAVEHEQFGLTPEINVEQLMTLDPDVIIVAADVDEPRPATNKDLEGGVPWRSLSASKSGSLYVAPGSWMASISHHAARACLAYAKIHQLVSIKDHEEPPAP